MPHETANLSARTVSENPAFRWPTSDHVGGRDAAPRDALFAMPESYRTPLLLTLTVLLQGSSQPVPPSQLPSGQPAVPVGSTWDDHEEGGRNVRRDCSQCGRIAVSVVEAARRIDLGRTRFSELVKSGAIPSRVIGSRRVVLVKGCAIRGALGARPESDFLPWDRSLVSWFGDHYVLVLGRSGTYVYLHDKGLPGSVG